MFLKYYLMNELYDGVCSVYQLSVYQVGSRVQRFLEVCSMHKFW